MEVKSPAVETPAPKIASPVQQVKEWDEILIVKKYNISRQGLVFEMFIEILFLLFICSVL